jgi:cell division protein FtsZ
MADQVLLSGVASVTDLIVKPGLINLDFADVRAVMRDMGKAMMGTGEASGENRAILAAEAAIANPLLDETSMKGARGLLISITGGTDMKIFEVDQAANRIREEVDVDANVIFGATQDEALDGIMRVSVVATGLDRPISAEGDNSAQVSIDERLAHMAERLRSQLAARAAERPAAPPAQPQPVMQAPAPSPQPMMFQPAPVAEMPQPLPVMHTPDLVVEQTAPRASFFAQPVAEAPRAPVAEEPAPMETFIPPAPERIIRPQRLPAMEDLPRPAQALMQNRQEAMPAAPPPQDQKRMTLMQRLAQAGFGRKTEEPVTTPQAEAPQAPVTQTEQSHPTATHALYARRAPAAPAARPAQGNLDPQGRVAAPVRNFEEDQLEIPAFLRRNVK